ncbi:Histone-lysine N-methyltransferase set9 [Plenodomus lingam]|uniref:Histone-lysine N-methyltransferase SET9 n=1 Tax=Leptosphaeria maculans (strain JN3 / isolate v23.1.3 / race Av1-4-5-6-7-8) TaxID=985895 RepID=E5A1N3_LEPMJ|nr:similar to gi/121919568/sp/Q0U3A4.1/SET9_PHANO RecName: Full=Histone-lysine N-methyltransferase SET9; AltName: Full=SET domain protein 9 [Plenodomus lingam JN3]KAH9867789.1 Histone-lysine N-methyltransferase set9 [Plenodomus lingam]CBX97497.1 similar to gi/121919568/sp/Q0U3A4.1/SET9_PHANO RecName: Full=Histone-lysine N-methyltransferase SET9; AltName: Full=SET domain protein 9 [Plenodomus lingam JN3]
MAPSQRGKSTGKTKLTLETLAQYDDVITDALVDKVYYWTIIRKNRGGRFTSLRGLHEEDIANILRKHVIWDKDPTEAVVKLLQLPGLRKFVAGLKTERDQEQFKRHLRRYVNIYMSDCPFEVTTTNRYTITEHEASVTARRDISAREEIKYLTGVQVAMTEEQEKTLELQRKDFSLVYSSRKKTRSLFLGPARFANHDCDPNAKLATKGYDGMQIVAVKPIDEGEEITVSYGDDYFGDDNEECLCRTCEERQQNGWAPMKRVEEESDEEEQEGNVEQDKNIEEGQNLEQVDLEPASDGGPPTPFPPKRKRDESTEEDFSQTCMPFSKRVRIEKSSLCKQRASEHLREATLKKAHSMSALHEQIPVSSVENPSTNVPTCPQVSQDIRNDLASSRETTPQSPTSAHSPKSSHSTDATSTDATSIDEDLLTDSTGPKIKVEPEIIHDRPALGVAMVKEEVTTTTVNAPWPSPPAEDYMSDLSELSESFEFDSENEQIVKRKPRPIRRTTRSKSRFEIQNFGTPVTMDDTDDFEYVENKRKPGDYMTSSSLLSAKYSKWNECYTCENWFVQQDGYNTRKDCPRCERHSKLYGFAWPKTEKEGKHDKEERIRDHRVVHRFVDPDEERQLKRERPKKAIKQQLRDRFSTPRSARTSLSESVEVDSGRRRRRLRKTM